MATRYLIGALSAAGYENRRRVCRETWAVARPGIDVVFLVGDNAYEIPPWDQNSAPSTTTRLRFPRRTGDILELPVPDGYRQLPQKTRAFCRWALERDDWDWLMKCDDDSFVALDRLAAWEPPDGAEYVGAEWKRGVRYGSGACYLLSRRAAGIVAMNMTHHVGAEDQLVGRVLSAAGIPLRIDQRIIPICHGPHEFPAPGNELIATHIAGGATRWDAVGETWLRQIAAGLRIHSG